MTREEAIKELKEDIELYIPLHGTIDDVDRDLPDGRLITALEMGIKALEQEPCENAISRQAVLDLAEWFELNKQHFTVANLIDEVENIPPVNPQPKTGHWIKEINDYGETIGWHCDKCYEDSGFTTDCKWDYCPNCGAKMEGEKCNI